MIPRVAVYDGRGRAETRAAGAATESSLLDGGGVGGKENAGVF